MKIVLTGRPDVGKTTIAHIMQYEFTNDVVVGTDALDLFETISIPELKSAYSKKCYQRALYHIQVELENIATDRHPDRVVLCDHGTLDCLTQWPESPPSFFKEIHSSLEEELARYDWVIQINDSDQKFEKPMNLVPPLDARDFWRLHPHFLSIPAKNEFSFSYLKTAQIIKEILKGHTYEKIRESLGNSVAQNSQNVGVLEAFLNIGV